VKRASLFRSLSSVGSGGHSLCHSGNGIREWSGNRCMFVIPREFPFPFPFPPNSFGEGGGQFPYQSCSCALNKEMKFQNKGAVLVLIAP